MRVTRIIALLVAAILAIIVIAQNTAAVETRLLFFSVTMPRAILLILTLLVGFVLGVATTTYMDSPMRGRKDES